ncbi:hypothetical protein [Staphylococcus lutrae]|uniref:Uncharacterized protein n=1 Tax=Staphylococcus lutrae TaxID=155085 RepID=A0AAC9RSQ3_9STAP|nr:hypothetical protein [Staphylococcus lutrae]ARJ51004.1 hypothetical protein B5P37_06560 [Staphylococcus lutrae]PNZ37142.1 hypothetical protein CD134_06980 [Staphylococcus lutrae]
MEEKGKALKVWAWVFIVLTVAVPLFGIGSIICGNKYKKYHPEKGAKLVKIATIVLIISVVMYFLRYTGLI